jgi:outer membrane protein OmpA-like peptidoglycan-associated protein
MFSRRALVRLGLLAGWPALAWPVAKPAALPPGLADLAYPGAVLSQEQDPANTANKTYRAAGTLPSGATQVQAFQGTRLFDMRLPGDPGDSATEHKRIVDLLKHYDTKVAQAGGKRLNTGFDAGAWTDVNARMVLYSRPTPEGEVSFGLWIQDGGMTHWLMLFPASDTRAPAKQDELATRLANFGRAPLYILFDTGKAELKADGVAAVQQIAGLMKAAPDWQLSIEGHTDNVGQAPDNQKLSQARAEAVMKAVVAQGIDAKRLSAVGLGQTKPVADNGSEQGRAKNRRVELVKRS